MTVYEYRAINRLGGCVAGITRTVPAEFVAAKYRSGWKELAIKERNGSEDLGQIYTSPDTGKRIWWAAS